MNKGFEKQQQDNQRELSEAEGKVEERWTADSAKSAEDGYYRTRIGNTIEKPASLPEYEDLSLTDLLKLDPETVISVKYSGHNKWGYIQIKYLVLPEQSAEATDSEYNYLTGQVHIEKESKSLCNQDGEFLNLCTIEDFQKVPPVNRCGRCQRLIGVKYPDVYSLSEKQKGLLIAIFRKTKKDNWCFATKLSKNKSSSGRTSLHRSLKRLQHRGYIEKKVNRHNRVLVRLTDRLHITKSKSGKILYPGVNQSLRDRELHLNRFLPPAGR